MFTDKHHNIWTKYLSKRGNRNFVEAMGLIAVVASLVFVALEIRQSNRIALVETELGIREVYNQLNQSVYTNKDVSELLAKSQKPNLEYNSTELEMIWALAFSTMNIWQATETAFVNGLVPRSTLDDAADDINVYVRSYPAMHPIWRDILRDYQSAADFEVYRMLESALDQNDQ